MISTAQRPHTRRLLVALMALGGLLLALGFPNELLPEPLGDHPLALWGWLAALCFVWGAVALPPRTARWGAWAFGLFAAIGILSWMRLFGLLPWLLASLYLSLLPVVALWLAQRAPGPRWLSIVALAAAWAGLEWLRGQSIFGFQWGDLGMTQLNGILAPLLSVGGVPLATFLMLLVTGAVALRRHDPATPRVFVLAALGIFLAALAAGHAQTRVSFTRWRENPQTLQVAVVQPSTQVGLQAADLERPRTLEEWQQEYQRRLATLVELSSAALQPPEQNETRLLIWPESALPDPPYDLAIGDLCQATRSALIVGAPGAGPGGEPRNSAYLLGADGFVRARYDKMHLVPFGEYIPFLRPLIDRFYSVRQTDLTPGERRTTLQVGEQPVGIGICFESTFPAIARAYAQQGAHYLVFITNDAWFGRTPAVAQHFDHARARALETGLPVARAASTGISGFIAPDGRVLESIPLNVRDTRASGLPAGAPGTLATRGGWLFGPLALLAPVALALARLRRRPRVASPST